MQDNDDHIDTYYPNLELQKRLIEGLVAAGATTNKIGMLPVPPEHCVVCNGKWDETRAEATKLITLGTFPVILVCDSHIEELITAPRPDGQPTAETVLEHRYGHD